MAVPVISVEQMREWENASWAAGVSEADVIRLAGAAVGRLALRLTRPGDRILILAGKGNNGADARAAAPELSGREVEILRVTEPEIQLPGFEAALAAQPPALIIDGLFGLGLDRPLDPPWVQLIEAVNRARRPVLAVDVPSGLNAETGETAGAAICASVTLTMAAPKVGLLKGRATDYVGRLEVASNIGLVPCPIAGELQWTLPEDFAAFPPARPVISHKSSFGHLAMVAGSFGYHGAAVLAARGAQRAMPGLITLLTTQHAFPPVAAQLQSVMVGLWSAEAGVPETTDAMMFGPGLAGPDVPEVLRNKLSRAWQTEPFPMLADASGLDFVLPEPRGHDFWRVITPHPGEAARALHVKTEAVQRDRVGALRELSYRFGDCLVVLKGHQTLVGSSKGPVFINSSANPGLAQGGAGDVLAGFLGGLIAQAAFHNDIVTAIRYGVWQHGAGADWLAATRKHWTIEELPEAMSASL